MPNWCSSRITITKATNEQIERIRAAVTADRLLDEFFPQPDWRQVPNEDGHLPGPEYARWIKGSTGAARNWPEGSRFPNGDHDERWYYWRTDESNWGTKWEISEATLTVDDSTVTIYCSSAWSPPGAAWFEKLSEAMPNAVITNVFYETGADFYGVTFAQGGDAILISRPIEPELRNQFFKDNLTKEQLAIIENVDHDEFDEVNDLANDLWWDNEQEYIYKSAECLLQQGEDQIASLQQTA